MSSVSLCLSAGAGKVYAAVVPKPEQYLSPLYVLFRLAQARFESPGMKIGVLNDRIKFYPPGNDQNKERARDGVGRGDFGSFLAPLEKAARLWPDGKNEHIVGICDVIAGIVIDKLALAYPKGPSVNAVVLGQLENFRTILNSIVKGNIVVKAPLTQQEIEEKNYYERQIVALVELSNNREEEALKQLFCSIQKRYLEFIKPPSLEDRQPIQAFPQEAFPGGMFLNNSPPKVPPRADLLENGAL